MVNTNDIQNITKTSFSFEHDFLPNFRGRLKAFLVHGEFVDIGVPLDYTYACQKFS